MKKVINTIHYLNEFQNAADKLDRKILKKKQINIKSGIWLDSVVLKLWKESWTNKYNTAKKNEPSIFFSIWLEEKGVSQNQIFYNIHALKLRKLAGYSIESRMFASSFREKFKFHQSSWQNVSVNFGPQTLMRGWIEINLNKFENVILKLVNQFLEIDFIIDELLEERKKINKSDKLQSTLQA